MNLDAIIGIIAVIMYFILLAYVRLQSYAEGYDTGYSHRIMDEEFEKEFNQGKGPPSPD